MGQDLIGRLILTLQVRLARLSLVFIEAIIQKWAESRNS